MVSAVSRKLSLSRVLTHIGRTALAISTRTCSRSASNINIRGEPTVENTPRRSTPRRPDATSQILDTIDKPPTPQTRQADQLVSESDKQVSALGAEVNALSQTSRILDINNLTGSTKVADVEIEKPSTPKTFNRTKTPKWPRDPGFVDAWKEDRLNPHEVDRFFAYHAINRARGTDSSANRYEPKKLLSEPPKPADLTLPMLLANQCHLGHATSLWNPSNSGYIFGVRDGIHVISLDVTYAYLKRAAKVIEEVARMGGVILFVGTRPGFRDIVVNAAKEAKGYHIFDRWVPGTLSNGQQILGDCAVQVVDNKDNKLEEYDDILSQGKHQVMRPDLVVCLNPMENQVLLHECGVFTIPTIGIIDTDANPTWVTYPIPANDDSLRSVALVAGTLGQAAKEGQRQRLLEAESGKQPYSTKPVEKALTLLNALLLMDPQEPSEQDESNSA